MSDVDGRSDGASGAPRNAAGPLYLACASPRVVGSGRCIGGSFPQNGLDDGMRGRSRGECPWSGIKGRGPATSNPPIPRFAACAIHDELAVLGHGDTVLHLGPADGDGRDHFEDADGQSIRLCATWRCISLEATPS